MSPWLKWGWRVTANGFYVLVVLYVFSTLQGRPETIIVPILGLIYTAIRGVGIGSTSMFLALAQSFQEMEALLKKMAAPYPELELDPEGLEEFKASLKDKTLASAVDSFFIGVISLICIAQIFRAVG